MTLTTGFNLVSPELVKQKDEAVLVSTFHLKYYSDLFYNEVAVAF